jgi:hypothetical protein
MDRPIKEWLLKLFWLLIYLYYLYSLAPHISGKEGLGGYIAINKDYIIANYAGQDIRDRAEDKARILPK